MLTVAAWRNRLVDLCLFTAIAQSWLIYFAFIVISPIAASLYLVTQNMPQATGCISQQSTQRRATTMVQAAGTL